jgi:hypothetical protein
MVSTPASGSLFAVGTTTVTATATDAQQTRVSCNFTVTVTYTAPPPPSLTISCPANQTVASTDGAAVFVAYPAPTASGGVAPVTVVATPASGSLLAVGTTTVTATATDAQQTHATCSFTVTVSYTAPPPLTYSSNGQIPSWGPDPLETSHAPAGYLARVKAPINQMHFTAGQPLRFFADTADPNEWPCPPYYPPYVCPDQSVTFFVMAPRSGPGPVTDYDMWELRL